MFEDSGKKLKKTAKILFIISIIGTIVLAFSLGVTRKYTRYDSYLDFDFMLLFLILVSGFVFSYIECLLLYAFGELIENTRLIRCNINDLGRKPETRTHEACSNYGVTSGDVRTRAEYKNTENIIGKRFVTCSVCGEENSIGKLFCVNCAAKL